MPFSNELDIFVSQNTKEKIWNMGYIDLAILLRNNCTVPNEMQNCMSVDNGRLVIRQMNKVVRAKHRLMDRCLFELCQNIGRKTHYHGI